MSVYAAPGKVVLLGEYAVLDGAPSLVLAVDRGVRCAVEPAEVLSIEVPGGDDRFVRAALLAVGAPAARYRFEDTHPRSGPKVGLGGSAAATVAAAAAGSAFSGAETERDALFRVALATHRAVQGSGSGVDVAASTYGGWLRYASERASPISAPALLPSVVYSGASAQTGPRVQRYLAMTDRGSFVEESRALVERFSTEPLSAMREAATLLQTMARRAGIDYWTHAIDRIVRLASVYGGAAKPSGAGGGDIVVALLPDEASREAFEASARGAGFFVVEVRPSPGVRRVLESVV